MAVVALASLAACSSASGPSFAPAPANTEREAVAKTIGVTHALQGKLGPVLTAPQNGTITGWDVDQTQGIGMLSAGYNNGTRLETFDLKTAKVTKLGSFQSGGQGSVVRQYIVLRILANDLALVDDLDFHSQNFQRDDTFLTVSPVSQAKVSGRWTPPHPKDLLVNPSEGWVSVNQTTTTNAVMADRNTLHKGGGLEVLISDVAKNSFGQTFRPPSSQVFEPPYDVAQNTATGEIVIPMQIFTYPFDPFEPPSFDLLDPKTENHTIFSPNVGSGSVMGIAIDPTTKTMCTTTSEDSNVEFYDLKAKTAFAVPFPGEQGQGLGGGAVAVDPLNHLFIVTQPTSPSGGSIVYVYDEKGNVREAITGFSFSNRFAAVFAYVAVNPKLRIGYATAPNADQIQSFTY